jgi:hypothetical protein
MAYRPTGLPSHAEISKNFAVRPFDAIKKGTNSKYSDWFIGVLLGVLLSETSLVSP